MVVKEIHRSLSEPLPVQKGVTDGETLEVEFLVFYDQFRQCWYVEATVTFPGDEEGVWFQLWELYEEVL